MTDDELISVLVDTDAGLGPAEGYGPTIEAVRALIAERDRLQAVVREWQEAHAAYTGGHAEGERAIAAGKALAALEVSGVMGGSPRDEAHDFTETEMLAGLYPAVKAERDRLRAVVEDAVDVLGGEDNDYDEWTALLGRLRAALDTRKGDVSDDELRRDARRFGPQVRRAGEAGDCPHGELRHTCYVCDLEAERDRLRAEVDRCGDLLAEWASDLAAVRAERDRLRAVVDAVRYYIATQVSEADAPEEGAAWERMIAALERLDASANAGGDQEGPASFARARSLLGRRVKATLMRDSDDPAAIAEGRFLRICEGGEIAIEADDGFVYYCWPMLDIEAAGDESSAAGAPPIKFCPTCGTVVESSAGGCLVTGHRPFSELSDALRRRLADRDAERQRIWAAIQSWAEVAHRLDDGGRPVAVEGTVFRPLEPFFDELHAMVFPDDYLNDDEVRESSAGGASAREGEGGLSLAAVAPQPADGAPGTTVPGAPPGGHLSDDEIRAQMADPPWLTKKESDEVLKDLDTARQALYIIEQLAAGHIDPWTWPGAE